MSTVGTLKSLSASSLSALLLAEQAAAAGDPAIAVIDVRDDGTVPLFAGHIAAQH
jgi:hypothetical protein